MMSVLDLTPAALAFLMGTVLLAGVVRGFTGFAASAVVMALATLVLPPLDLLPICLLLEIVASLLLVRGSLRDADLKLVLPMVGFAFAALPFGLYLTQIMDADRSRLVALGLVALLATLQLGRLTLALGRGLVPSALVGGLAGLVQGLAAVGGLVQALYVVGLNMQPRTMRATMIFGVMLSGVIGLFWQLTMGVMTGQSVLRVVTVLLPYVIGLWLGWRMFTPDSERYYRIISLTTLIVLSLAGIVKQVLLG